MRLICIATAAALALSIGAQAAEKKHPSPAKTWTQEPSSFLGLGFDGSSVLSLPRCTPGVIGFQQKQLCREDAYAGKYYTIEGKPSIGLRYNYQLAATVQGGVVESFMMSGNTQDFETVCRLFTEKYGAPTSRLTPSVKTKAGASFTNDTLIWSGTRVMITLERFSDDINTFGAAILNRAAVEASAKASEEKVRSNASKL